MALTPQLVEVQLQGLDTKTDAKLLVPGKLVQLENARFEKTGRISKRIGSNLVQVSTDAIKRIYGLGKSLFAIKSDGTTGETFERRDNTNGNMSMGQMAAPRAWTSTLGTFDVSSGVEASWTVDSARLSGNVVVYVTNETTGQTVYWYDTVKQTVVAKFKSTAVTNADRVRILVTSGGKVLVALYKATGTKIDVYEFTTTSATFRATFANIFSTWPNVAWDWCTVNYGIDMVYFGYVEATSNLTLQIASLNCVSWATATTATWAAAAAVTSVGIAASQSFSLIRIFWGTAGGLYTRSYDNTLANTLASTLVEAAAGEERRSIGVYIDPTLQSAHVAWNVAEFNGTTAWHNHIRYALVNVAGAPGTIFKTRGAGLVSKPYVVTQGGVLRVFVCGALGVTGLVDAAPFADEQRGYVFLEVSTSSPALRARLLYMIAGIAAATRGDAGAGVAAPGRYRRYGLLMNLHTVGDPTYSDRGDLALTTFGCAGVSFDSDPSSADLTLSAPTARLMSCSLTTDVGYTSVEFDGCLLVTGGVLHSFDGRTMRENGYVAYPVITDLVFAIGGGFVADGTYEFVFTYERTDARGRVVASATSTPKKIVVAGGGGVAQILVNVTTYRLGLATGETEHIVCYRSAAGGTTHRRAKVKLNSTIFDEIQVVIDMADATIAPFPPVYTDGGESDHWQPSAPYALCVGEDRPYCVSGDDPYRAQVAKPIAVGESPAFFPEFFRSVPSDDGPITALMHRDDGLMAWKSRQFYYAFGRGPDAGGNNDDLGDLKQRHQDVGAIDQRSVLATEAGFIARGQKGFWMVDRALARSYVGAEIEEFAKRPSLDASYTPDRNEARFVVISSSDATRIDELVWNDFYGTWSVNPSVAMSAVTIVDGARNFVSDPNRGAAFGGLHREIFATADVNANYFDSQYNNAYYVLRIVSGWLHFGGLQGFERLYELLLLGELKTAHTIQVSLSYDYVDTVIDSFTLDSADAVIGSSAYQFSIQPSLQKIQAVKIAIYDSYNGTIGEGFNLAGLAAWVGTKGKARLGATKRGA